MNIFKEECDKYLSKGYSVIPDKFMAKTPAIKNWSSYCFELPSSEEVDSWKDNFDKSNIAICLGQASGVVALDIDEVRPDILEVILPMLPKSPVVKRGSKGETRFFRYTGVEHTQSLKFGGEMVIELLSNNKKTTIPPSVHPNGSTYEWCAEGYDLLEAKKDELPMLPPALFASVEQKLLLKFPDMQKVGSTGKLHSGRNDALVSLCGKLIAEQVPLQEAIQKLIEEDERLHDPPLFTDTTENYHTEPQTNALQLYSNVLESINRRRFRDSKEYEVPVAKCITAEEIVEAKRESEGKLIRMEDLKRRSQGLPSANGVLEKLQSNILSCSWVKQPSFAFSASLVFLSTIISRKVVFQGMSPNLYVLNIAASGSGKDAPQKKVQEFLIDANAEHLLGAGDYVSDASLMDGLSSKPVRLDIMDEAGGILRTVNDGRSEYNSKMADVLAELYTSSTSKYLGRATADGLKGSCYRPNVNILASTTPTGFQEGVSLKAIEKGLLGRFLIFYGDKDQPAERLKSLPHIDTNTLNRIRFWVGYKPEENNEQVINGITQEVTELKASEEANERLDKIFYEFDDLRRSKPHTDPSLPIIARLYQQMVKITMIHACSRANMSVPTIEIEDVEFGYLTIKHYYETIQDVLQKHIFNNSNEKNKLRVLNVIKELDYASKRDIYNSTRDLTKRERDSILEELIELGFIDTVNVSKKSGGYKIAYKFLEENNEDTGRERVANDDGDSRPDSKTISKGRS